jgi:hypothetical protein
VAIYTTPLPEVSLSKHRLHSLQCSSSSASSSAAVKRAQWLSSCTLIANIVPSIKVAAACVTEYLMAAFLCHVFCHKLFVFYEQTNVFQLREVLTEQSLQFELHIKAGQTAI